MCQERYHVGLAWHVRELDDLFEEMVRKRPRAIAPLLRSATWPDLKRKIPPGTSALILLHEDIVRPHLNGNLPKLEDFMVSQSEFDLSPCIPPQNGMGIPLCRYHFVFSLSNCTEISQNHPCLKNYFNSGNVNGYRLRTMDDVFKIFECMLDQIIHHPWP